MQREIKPKTTEGKGIKIYDLICKINDSNSDRFFGKIVAFSCVGDIRSGAMKHPLQYIAYSTVREGDDDPFEGVGWTAEEALTNLLKSLT